MGSSDSLLPTRNLQYRCPADVLSTTLRTLLTEHRGESALALFVIRTKCVQISLRDKELIFHPPSTLCHIEYCRISIYMTGSIHKFLPCSRYRCEERQIGMNQTHSHRRLCLSCPLAFECGEPFLCNINIIRIVIQIMVTRKFKREEKRNKILSYPYMQDIVGHQSISHLYPWLHKSPGLLTFPGHHTTYCSRTFHSKGSPSLCVVP